MCVFEKDINLYQMHKHKLTIEVITLFTNRNYSAILATLQITSYVHSRNPT